MMGTFISTQVRTKHGILEGVDSGTYLVFKGVPYAKPPVGELRFKAPQEPECWEGVRKAVRHSVRKA